jgi:DNA-binding PadR family transcriptional regulator
MASPQELSLGAWAVVALLCEGDTHGWALVRAMEPNGEIGRVWSMRRALVYRTVDLVVAADLVERAGVEQGARGSTRTLLRATAAGRGAVARWLGEPVVHVRDLRSELLLKLLFAQRSGLDRAPLLRAQQAILVETVDALEARIEAGTPAEITVRAFRLETARAGVRFVEGELARLTPSG